MTNNVMSTYKFKCGCEIPIIDETIKQDNLPSLKIPYEELAIKVNYGKYCPESYKLIHEGKNKGVFQLESYLGNKWGSALEPNNIEELAALVSIIRPACLNALSDGKSLTQTYVDRKHGKDENVSVHPALDDILNETYNVLCIHENTMISLHDGQEIPIKDIKIGDKLNSIDQDSYKCVVETCDNICVSPKTNGVKLTLENGWSIVLTNDHKVYTLRGAVEVQQLNENDVIQFVINQPYTSQYNKLPYYDDDKWAYLCGHLVGDGCSGEAIASGTKNNHNVLLKYIQENFSNDLNIRGYYHTRSNYIGLSGKQLLKDSNNGHRKTIYRKFIEELTLDKTKNEKIIPKEIMSCSSNIRRRFLAGLFDADGHFSKVSNKNNTVLHFCTTNKIVLQQIRKLLSLDGIHSYLDTQECHVHVLNQQLFNKLIGPFLVVKKIHGNLSNGYSTGSFPKTILKEFVAYKTTLSMNKFCKSVGLSSNIFLKQTFAKMSTIKKCGYDLGDIFTMKVKKIEPIENQKFYSISVSGCHNLIGNGIVISNCYQEQAIKIATKVAGYSEENGDLLRRAVGKKDAALMSSLEGSFIEGCKTTALVDDELAKQLFEWIRESQQYSFNKSHAVSYGMISYLCAFTKHHFPLHFYAAWLAGARNRLHKEQEIRELCMEARSQNIYVSTPNIKTILWHNSDVCVDNDFVRMGIQCMRKIGHAETEKIRTVIHELEQQLGKIAKWSWEDVLYNLLPRISSDSVYGLITGGVFDYKSRADMLGDYERFRMLTKRQQEKLKDYGLSFKEGLIKLIDDVNKPQKEKIKSIIHFIKSEPDDPVHIIKEERGLYSIPLTFHPAEHVNSHVDGDTTCKQFMDGKSVKYGTNMWIRGEITNTRVWKVKKGDLKGRTMASFTLSDSTGNIQCVLFPELYDEYGDQIYDTNVIIVGGYRSKTNSFAIKELNSIY